MIMNLVLETSDVPIFDFASSVEKLGCCCLTESPMGQDYVPKCWLVILSAYD